ncbi:hypothetical protein RGUI_3467 [Rhodovulum sp. P5]|uniref:hypothetical protein n=1 Tax=Rhodovulum sp. P5 TaxID=1564506 RepID=UPI0009C36ABA|nr:hypothetical protein [Rhodovulum sp. P5]ARE41608.1 hypothetical protein RGUI_3467 [Rhodovulum sp. P5]
MPPKVMVLLVVAVLCAGAVTVWVGTRLQAPIAWVIPPAMIAVLLLRAMWSRR